MPSAPLLHAGKMEIAGTAVGTPLVYEDHPLRIISYPYEIKLALSRMLT